MAIRSFKPYTPGTRTRVVTDFSEVTSSKPERSLVVSKHRKKGRNNRGVITCRHRGGGIRGYIGLLIFVEISMVFRPKLRQFIMTHIGMQDLLYFSTLMVKRDTYLLLLA